MSATLLEIALKKRLGKPYKGIGAKTPVPLFFPPPSPFFVENGIRLFSTKLLRKFFFYASVFLCK
jgi:hypothetical protein